jgi:hypothetical protein
MLCFGTRQGAECRDRLILQRPPTPFQVRWPFQIRSGPTAIGR